MKFWALEVHTQSIEDTVVLDNPCYLTLIDVETLNEPFVIGVLPARLRKAV